MKSFKTCLKGIWSLFRPVRGRAAVSVIIGLVRIAASLSFVWICKSLVDIACGNLDKPLPLYIGLMVGIMLVQMVGGIAFSYWEGLNCVKTQIDTRERLFSHVVTSVWNGREMFHSADMVNRLEEDIRVVVDLLCSRFPDIIVTCCQLTAAAIFLLSLAPGLLWVLLILMVVAVLGSKMFFKVLRNLTSRIRKTDSQIQGHMQENLQHRLLVLTLIGSKRVLDRLEGLHDDLKDETVSRLNYNAIARTFMSLGFTAGYAAAFLWGVLGIKHGTVTFGMMTAFLQLVGQVQRPVAELGRHVPAFINSLTSVERLMEIEELEPETPGREVIFEEAPGIKISNLSFAYPDDVKTTVIDGLDFDFKPGTTTVIKGQTGAGKSTLIKLVMGLLKPSEGSVELYSADGTSSAISSRDTRSNFMYVPQGNSLMSGSIRDNLLLADASATDEQMSEALHLAAADFVFSLQAGLDTQCSEIGAGVSEGQAQRIAIARALLCKGGILILDEATSSLDPETEQLLLDNLARSLKGRKTILFISHREAVSAYADAELYFRP